MSHLPPVHVIIHDHPAPERGGIENMAYSIACALHARGQRVAVVGVASTLARSFADHPGIERVELKRPVRHPLLCTPRLITLLLRLRARYGSDQIVHMLVVRNVRVLRWLGALAPRRCVGYLHGNEVVRSVSRTPRRFARDLERCEHVVCNSTYTRDWAQRSGTRARLTVLHPRINLPANPPTRAESRRRLGLSDDATVCAMVSRLSRRKGHLAALRAVATLRERHPQIRLLIAGTGPMRNRIDSEIDQLGMRDHVQLLGSVSEEDKWSLFSAADFALMPSLTSEATCDVEGFGIANIEAAAMGAIPVATAEGGVREALDHGRAGILLPVADEPGVPAALASALASALADPDRIFQLREFARGRARRDFDWDSYVSTILTLVNGRSPEEGLAEHETDAASRGTRAAPVDR